MRRVLFATSLFMTLGASPLWAKTVEVKSPDGDIVVTVSDDTDVLTYSAHFKGQEVISPSKLGMSFKEQRAFHEGFSIVESKKATKDDTWTQPWGERKNVRDHHNELHVVFERDEKPKNTFSVRFRVFDDGIGFRYEVPKQSGMKSVDITKELTEFDIVGSDKAQAWWIPSRGWNRYEYIYNVTPLEDVDRAHTPFTFKLPTGVHMSIHEAALVDYAAMTLDQDRPGTFNADLTPWSDGIRVKTATPFKSPWRTVQISEDAVGLLNSDIILNLNEPNKLGDVSWVEPGKYVGIWWGMHINQNTWGSGEKHGATTEETKRYMDFAAKHGFSGVLVEGWNIGWDGDWYSNGDIFSFTETYPDFDLPAVTAYGEKKGVKLIGHHETSGSVTNYKNQMADAFDLYEKHGVAQVKTGYVTDGGEIKRIDEKGIPRYEWHDGQFMVGEYLRSVTEAAKRKISINTHEPVKDTGLRRTYPNWIAREGARGQEFNAWGSPPNPPEHTAILPFTRMLSGPMDYTPGAFDLAPYGLDAENRIKHTLAKELSLYVVLYSPIQMVMDLPENYAKRPEAFQFIVDVPTDWEESRAIAAEVGEHVAFARKERDGKDWYLGALTGKDPETLNLKLDFLDEGQKYIAEIYRDGKDADWLTNPYDMVIESKPMKRGDELKLDLAGSGGAAIRFKAVD